uniref:Uncharacterized protein n=1 Tax=Aplanochytrium stocchinoi TaxID=215587 RepID=A0A7S3V2K3_9STRA|mmetsp:Transcript_21078/g.25641  ORF Transcript_21078/g.25641 Transcript_21078/m.25641 type:complete len:287 (+) Transcript_21078:178-1038(+)
MTPILRDFGAASSASIIANLVTHPLENIKVRQIQYGTSVPTVFKEIVRNEGFSSLYRGMNAALIRAVISGGGRLTGFNTLKQVAIQHNILILNGNDGIYEVTIRALLATISACTAQYVSAPFDLIRTRQAAFKGTEGTPSMYSIVRTVIREHGLKGLFSGSSALMGRAITFNIAQLLTYDESKRQVVSYCDSLNENGLATHVLASMCAGLAATTASSPFENIKTLMQISEKKTGVVEITYQLYATRGLAAFFRGWLPLYFKIAPHTIIVFVVMERLRLVLGVKSID